MSGEALLWWFKDSPLQLPLVVRLPQPLSQILTAVDPHVRNVFLGTGDLDPGSHGGARFTAGFWLDGHRSVGLEAGYFFLAPHSTTQSVPSNGGPLARIVSVPSGDGAAGVDLLPLPDVGTLQLTSRLQSAEVNGVVKTVALPDLRVQVLGGFRFLDLRETLSLGVPGVPGGPGLVVPMIDQSDAENFFFGWQLGARAEYHLGNFFVGGTAKVALGDMYQRVNLGTTADLNAFQNLLLASFQLAPSVVGTPLAARIGQTAAAQSALGQSAIAFVTSTVQGGVAPRQITVLHFTRHALAVVPEVGLNVGWQLTNRLRAFAGYNFLYLSSMADPGNPFERDINVFEGLRNRLPGNPAGPGAGPVVISVTGSEFWAQGISGGIEFRY
jgi:hypothetical protein